MHDTLTRMRRESLEDSDEFSKTIIQYKLAQSRKGEAS